MKPTQDLLPRIAWSIAGASLLLIAAGVLLRVLAAFTPGGAFGPYSHLLTTPISGAVFAGLGGIVLSRHPRHPVAWMLSGLGLLAGIEVVAFGWLAYAALEAPGELIPAPDLVHWVVQWIHAPRAWIPLTLLILLFPDGKLPSRRWFPVAAIAGAGIALSTITSAFTLSSWEGFGGVVRNPFGFQDQALETLAFLGGGLHFVGFVSCFASVFVRYSNSTGLERQQVKWMAYTIAIVIPSFVIGGVLFPLLRNPRLALEVVFSIVNLATIGVAIAASIAVLRYRLFDIDLIINRTLVYGVLTALVVGVYVAVVGALAAVFQARGSLLISLFATGLIAVLFQPARDRLQALVNRSLYGHRDEPYHVLSQIGRRLEGVEPAEGMLATIVQTIAQSLKVPYVAISLAESRGKLAAETGHAAGDPLKLPLRYQGRRMGTLICSARSPGESFNEAEQRLLGDIAGQVAVAVYALNLSASLQRSRERLVTAREEERRRLRRDLHDGLGPQLASMAFKIDAARNQLTQDPARTDAILEQLRGQVESAIADIRRLVYNLRPPALDELGLLPALRSNAQAQFSTGSPRIVVDGPDALPALPAAVEVAAFRIAQEALTNVARHANAQNCLVRVGLKGGLELEVCDDGQGFPEPVRTGVGLSSMHERTAELGGSLRFENLPGGGARVLAQFPLNERDQ